MHLNTKKLIFLALFNISLFLTLIIGIQNSSDSKKVSFIIGETINLPISFIIGSSFIGGSLIGSLLKINFREKNE